MTFGPWVWDAPPWLLTITVVAAAAALLIAVIIGNHLHHAVDRHGYLVTLGRLLAGIDLMHGRWHWTDAGWFTRRGDVKVLHRSGHASWWQHQCLAFRTTCRCGPPLAAISYPIDPLADLLGIAVVVAVIVAVRTGHGRAWARAAITRLRGHRGNRVQPMGAAMATITGASAKSARAGVTWNPDYATAEPGSWVATWTNWPAGFKAAPREQRQVEDLWRSRVGFDLVFDWRTAIERPELLMTRARELPELLLLDSVVKFHDGIEETVRARIERLPATQTLIGIDDFGRPVCWDWKHENPHGLMNAGSRHGKTESEMAMVAQVLHDGGDVTYVDVKRVSIAGMKGVPGLTLKDDPRDMEGIWEAIAKWGEEMDARIDARTKDPTAEFRRSLLVLEEVNQLSDMWDEFWENWPEEIEECRGTIFWKPKHAKRTPPIWRVVRHGVWEGAFVNCNVLVAGQDIQAQVLKGIRNSIGMRLLGAYQPQNWKMLVGTTPVPAAPPVKGRWCMVNGSSQTWVQAVIADLDPVKSAAIWRDYARNGRRMDGSEPPAEGPVTGPFTVTGDGTIHTGQTSWSARSVTATATRPVTEPMSLLDITRRFLLPRGTPDEQKRRAQMLRQDRYRSDRGELPAGLTFPEPAVGADAGRAELFVPAAVIEFDKARRGSGGSR